MRNYVKILITNFVYCLKKKEYKIKAQIQIMSAAGSIQPQDAKLISTTNLNEETEDLCHKTNQLQLNDSSGTAATSHQNFKIRNNTYRKSQQMNVNRQYQMPYSPYPYSMLNSASLLTNTPIPMIPQNYMYPTSYQNNSNLYSSRNNQNNYFLTNSQKRAYVIKINLKSIILTLIYNFTKLEFTKVMAK